MTGHPPALGHVLGLGLVAVGHHVDEVGGGLGLALGAPAGDGESDGAGGGATVGEAEFGVGGESADELDAVHVVLLLVGVRFLAGVLSATLAKDAPVT